MIADAGVIVVGVFLLGVVVVVWSTDRLLEGMIGLASVFRLAPFAIAGVFSGLEAENVAVGLVAARGGVREPHAGSGARRTLRRLRRGASHPQVTTL